MAEFNTILFSQRLKEARMKKNIKQKELAEQIGVTPQTLSNYENASEATTKIPTTIVVMELADALGVSMDWLCGRDFSAKSKASELTTVGDYARVLAEVITWSGVGLSIKVEEVDSRYKMPQMAGIEFCDSDICEFLTHCKALLTLRHGNVISAEMFATSLSDRVSALEKVKKSVFGSPNVPWLSSDSDDLDPPF